MRAILLVFAVMAALFSPVYAGEWVEIDEKPTCFETIKTESGEETRYVEPKKCKGGDYCGSESNEIEVADTAPRG
jgi:hypothetical protein